MKRLIYAVLFIVSLLMTNIAEAQFRKIPAEVTNAFTAKFPKATNVEWRDQLVDFKVVFEEDGSNYTVKFNPQGEWLIMEREINQKDLPDEVKVGFSKSQFADWEVRNVSAVDTPLNDRQYKITVAKSTINKKDLLFNEDGKLLKDNFTL